MADNKSRPITIVLPRTSTVVRETVRERVTVPVSGDLDTAGNPVPTNAAHSYTYDGNNNLATDTVQTSAGRWVRTFTYQNGNQISDSGWVKQ